MLINKNEGFLNYIVLQQTMSQLLVRKSGRGGAGRIATCYTIPKHVQDYITTVSLTWRVL